MKSQFKKIMFAALVSSAAVTSLAFASGGGCGMHGEQFKPGMGKNFDPAKMKEHMNARLEKLAQTLNLRSDQTNNWNDYKTALLAQADARAAEIKAMQDISPPTTTPERMRKHEEMSKSHQESFSKIRSATETFYATLDAAQKTQFDQMPLFPPMGGPGEGRFHHHGKEAGSMQNNRDKAM